MSSVGPAGLGDNCGHASIKCRNVRFYALHNPWLSRKYQLNSKLLLQMI